LKKLLGVLLVIAVMAAVMAPVEAATTSKTVGVYVKNWSNKPVSGAWVRLDGGFPYHYTNSAGYTTFTMTINAYHKVGAAYPAQGFFGIFNTKQFYITSGTAYVNMVI